MFQCLYIILRESLIMYARVTKINEMETFIQAIVTENQ